MTEDQELSSPAVTNALVAALTMALEGSEAQHAWYNGLLHALEGVSAEVASRPPAPGRATVAAHAEHVRFTLGVANAWLRGERPEVDWRQSWSVSRLDAEGWERLCSGLRTEYETMLEAIRSRPVWREGGLAMAMNNVAHTAYHAGAIRQILKLEGAEGARG